MLAEPLPKQRVFGRGSASAEGLGAGRGLGGAEWGGDLAATVRAWCDSCMSLIDPDAARRLRARRVPTPRDLVPWAITAFVGAALLGYAISSMQPADEPNFVDDPLPRITVMMVLMPIGAIATLLAWIAWVGKLARNPALPGWSAPLVLALLGAALGASLSRPGGELLAAPRATPTVLLLCAGAAVLAVLTGISWARRRRRSETEAMIMRTGLHAEGTVTNQGYTHFSESSRLITRVTYAFVDAAGDRRFVQRAAIIEAGDPIVNGEHVDVWYDPQNAADVRRVVVRRLSRG